MTQLTIDIERVVIRTEAERTRLDGAPAMVQEAFRILGTRLEQSPLDFSGQGRAHALARLEVSMVQLDELLSTRGAERLADELYHQILRRTPWSRR